MVLAAWVKSVVIGARQLSGNRHFARLLLSLFLLFCLFVLRAIAIPEGGVFETARNSVFDIYQRLDPGRHSPSEPILIDINAESLRRIGQWPWSRDQLARLVDATAGARVVGLDVLLAEPDRLSPAAWAEDRQDLTPAMKQALRDLPSTDDALAASLARTPVVLAAVAGRTEAGPLSVARSITPILESGGASGAEVTPYGPLAWPLPMLSKAAAGVGLVSMAPEPDGITRRLPVIASADGMLVPSFAAEILRVASGADHIDWRASAFGTYDAVIGNLTIPADRSGRVWLRYSTGWQDRAMPAYRVLSGDIPRAQFRGRIVLIGTSAAGLANIVMTPVRQPESAMAVTANLVESMRAGDALRRPTFAVAAELLLALALGVAATLLIDRLTIWPYLLLLGALAMSLVIGSFAAFAIAGLLLDWTLPVAALIIAILATFAFRLREEALARRQNAVDLAAALYQAQAADRAKTEFLANVSHELRTPLNAIMGFSEIMALELHGPLLKVYADYSRDIQLSAKHLLSIISGILDLAVIDLGGRKPAADRIKVEQLVAECQRMVTPRADELHISIATATPAAVPMLVADAAMVRQMVLNLLSNAIKYSPPGGTVTVTTMLDSDGWLGLSVRDEGPGIAPADLPHILQRFARLRSATLAQQPGIGIGLALTRSMIELHGGKLKIKSEVDTGTEVILCFPPARLTDTKEALECSEA